MTWCMCGTGRSSGWATIWTVSKPRWRKRRLAIAEDRDGLTDVLHRCVGLAGLTSAFVAMVATRGRPRVFGSRRPADCENYLIAYAVPWIDVIPKDVQARGRPPVDRRPPARARCLGGPHGEELPVERVHRRHPRCP